MKALSSSSIYGALIEGAVQHWKIDAERCMNPEYIADLVDVTGNRRLILTLKIYRRLV